jgi:hypothetical protein
MLSKGNLYGEQLQHFSLVSSRPSLAEVVRPRPDA